MTRDQINRALDRAHDQARDQARAGNTPTLVRSELLPDAIHETWHVGCRTTSGLTYTVDLLHSAAGIVTQCDCPAAAAGRCCWHRGAARLAHQDAIPSRNAAGFRYRAKPAATVPSLAAGIPASALSGRRS